MKRFYNSTANCVTAIVSEDVYKDRERFLKIDEFTRYDATHMIVGHGQLEKFYHSLRHLDVPVFTFADTEDRLLKNLLSGTREACIKLLDHIVAQGWELEYRDFYVPWSDGFGTESATFKQNLGDYRYVTSRVQFRDAFGIGIDEL